MLCQNNVFKFFHFSESRYKYVMELNMPGCIVWPRWLNSHITAPHERAANTVKYRESGGMGLTAPDVEPDDDEYGAAARGMKDDTTRDTT